MKTHSGNMIAEYKTQGEWEIRLTIAIKFISSKDSNETRNMHSKSDIEIIMGIETHEIIEEFFECLLQGYYEELEESIKRRQFIFESVDVLCCNLNKISLNRGGSYIDSPEWLKNKKSKINPKNNDNKWFHYAVSVALNHKNIVKDSQRISKIKPTIVLYNWKEINFLSHKKDWKKFELNDKSIALNSKYVICSLQYWRKKTCI